MNFQALSLKAPQNCAIRSPRKGSRVDEESGWGSMGASCVYVPSFVSGIEDQSAEIIELMQCAIVMSSRVDFPPAALRAP